MIDLDCKCNGKGTQINQQTGDWCWVEESPCKLLTGNIVRSNGTWANCEHNGTMQIDCPGNKIIVYCNHKIDILAFFKFRYSWPISF